MDIKDILATVTMVFVVVLLVSLLATATVTNYQFREQTYVVISGDCLWDIASKYCPNGMDKWEYIEKVRDANGLMTYTIQPGQVLTVFEADA